MGGGHQEGRYPTTVRPRGAVGVDGRAGDGAVPTRAGNSCLPLVRVHDLRHSFACRLRAAGVSAEDREDLLGHANHSMAGHYASADVGHLLKQANLVLNRSGTQTILRLTCGSYDTVRCLLVNLGA